MPLPGNAILSLQGSLAVTEQSKPKQAMLVRMSAETFEALQAQEGQPKVEVEMGENPGIYIGDTFFPMRAQQEQTPHELYIRHMSANKPNPTTPLRFYGNVTGKFIVERQLGERVESVVRDKTAAAEKQRLERKTVLLDAPLPVQAHVKTAKKKSTATKRLAAEGVHSRTLSASSSAQPSRMVSPRPPTLPVKDSQPSRLSPLPPSQLDASFRAPLIHYVALNPRSLDDVLRNVGGIGIEGVPSTRRALSELLREVAQSVVKTDSAGPAPTRWILKQKTWLEVRPYTYPNLQPAERAKLAKKATSAFEAMKIPENDPRWAYLRPKEGTAASTASGTSDTKNGKARGSDVRAASSSKARSSDMPPPRDRDRESSVRRSDTNKQREERGASVDRAMKPPARRVPGSGFKMKSGSDTPPTPELLPSKVGSASASKADHYASSSASRHSASLPPAHRERRPSVSSNASTTRVPLSSKEVGDGRVGDASRDRRESPAPVQVSFKRKKPRDELESELSERETGASSKKRKLLEGSSLERDRDREREKERERRKERDLSSLPKKPVAALHDPSPPPVRSKQASKYDARSPNPPTRSPLPGHSPLPSASSPMLPPKPRHERVPSVSSQQSRDDHPHHRSGSSRARRPSPHFTSSEEEGDQESGRRRASPRPRESHNGSRGVDKAGTNGHTNGRTKKANTQSHHIASLPEDVQALRRVYKRRWPIWESLHRRHTALVEEVRDMLDSQLNRQRAGEGDEYWLSEGDPGLPSLEEMGALREELGRMAAELNAIVDKHERVMRERSRSNGPSGGKDAEEPLARPIAA